MKKIFTLSFVCFLLMMGMVDGQASFTANTTSVCSNNCSGTYPKMTAGCVSFTDNSLGNPTDWLWTFPGGTPANAGIQNPTVCYCQPGNWNVTLHINGPNGPFDTTFINYIHAGDCPVANFSYPDLYHHDSICIGKCLSFIDQSTNSPTEWNWTFTGASVLTSTTQNPENICYDNPGTFNVQLIADNFYGSDTSQTQNIVVIPCPQPSANFTMNPGDTICHGQCITFINTSTQGAGPIIYTWWTFQGGTPSSDSTINPPCIYFYTPGVYQITLVDSNAFGYDTVLQNIVVGSCTAGIENVLNKNVIGVYPNPASSSLTINNLPLTNNDLQITDVLGNEVYHQAINNSTQTTINISNLSNGVYFYQLINNNETYRGKFVKQ